jgi:hypothetical protein
VVTVAALVVVAAVVVVVVVAAAAGCRGMEGKCALRQPALLAHGVEGLEAEHTALYLHRHNQTKPQSLSRLGSRIDIQYQREPVPSEARGEEHVRGREEEDEEEEEEEEEERNESTKLGSRGNQGEREG